MKILLVDDNMDITDLLSKYLRAKGFENDVVNDPRQAISIIKEEKYDAILLDISMPFISGIDIIKTLESEKILKNQKIIILSAQNFDDSQIQSLLKKDGITGYLQKPISLNLLMDTITA